MTIDMTFERREELIRRDEHAAGREEGSMKNAYRLRKHDSFRAFFLIPVLWPAT